jgi:hypothetical protein
MDHGAKDIAVLEKPWWNRCFLLFPELNGAPQGSEHAEKNKHCNDAHIGPVVSGTSPLKSQ